MREFSIFSPFKKMIRYKKYKDNRENSVNKGMVYARAVHELIDFDDFIKHMHNHHSVYSEGLLRGILIDMENCLRELLLDGKAVRLGELGIFKIGLHTKAAPTVKDFNVAQNVKGCRMNLFLGKRFRAADLLKDMHLKEADAYTPDDLTDEEEQAAVDNNSEEP